MSTTHHQHRRPITGRHCNSNDLISVREGVQCGNCLALVVDSRPRRFGPAAFLAKLDTDAPTRARQILARVWLGSGNLTQAEAEWIDQQQPGDAWPAQKCLDIASQDRQPVPRIPARYLGHD